MASPIDPMVKTYSMPTPKVSKKLVVISGIFCAIYGLDELPAHTKEVTCLYLMHPRLSAMDCMEGVAALAIADWNKRLQDGKTSPEQANKGLIAVAFDQRNHGSRLVDKLSNDAWRQGNPHHAQDMFATFQGTARDVSFLIDFLPSYAFPTSPIQITTNLVLGVSLGAHAGWCCILHEPRITGAVIIVGCPDYLNLMVDRARLSKLPSWTSSSPPGAKIMGSEAFPQGFLDRVRHLDPAAFFLKHMAESAVPAPIRDGPIPEPTEKEKEILCPVLSQSLAGKRILLLSGGSDKLVPYHRGEAFLTWLKKAISPDGGWFADGGVSLEDLIFEGVGHEVTPEMVDHAIEFIGESLLAGDDTKGSVGKVRTSKI
ncbi:hypothetical protein AJ80_05324 [Polytolypa hystricis UAMH7299]|uniref:AB hydrolase-1 domain-containing protein n=1 Tax=Polytolypa hystricis (strain UAMH7299) TaxID=1447883 RepID=A0A2B7Y4Q3_POLH7|nr:hypothetical protein AJ80_05324 [Polytolypa hystricis UAMH7299]